MDTLSGLRPGGTTKRARVAQWAFSNFNQNVNRWPPQFALNDVNLNDLTTSAMSKPASRPSLAHLAGVVSPVLPVHTLLTHVQIETASKRIRHRPSPGAGLRHPAESSQHISFTRQAHTKSPLDTDRGRRRRRRDGSP